MNPRSFRFCRCLLICFGILTVCSTVSAQSSKSGPINLDRALQEETPRELDRAASYYHYSIAKWYENNGDAVRALSEMQLALDANPLSSAIHYELAIMYARRGNIDMAIRYANEAVELDAENPDPHWLLSNIHLRMLSQRREVGLSSSSNSDLRQAIQEFEILEKLTPKDERVYYSLGAAYFELNEPEKAIEAYEKYQKYARSDAGYREIARYYESIGNLDMAAEYLSRGLEVQPDSVETLMALSNIYLRQKKTRDAAPILKNLLDLSNGNPQLMRGAAAALFETGEYREVVKVLEELDTKARLDRNSQLLLGRSHLELNHRAEAIRIFKEVLAKLPYDMEARFYLGRAYEEGGQYRDAVQIYEALVNDRDTSESTTNHTLFQQRLAAVWLELGEYDKAIALYEEMAKADSELNFQLLNAYLVSKQYDKGIALVKALVDKKPEDINMNIVYAQTLSEAGKGKAGAELLSNLLKSHPENIDIYINLSEIYREDKRAGDAEKILLRGEERNKKPEDVEKLKFQRAALYERQKEFDRAETLFREILKNNPDNATVLNYLGYMLADRGVRLDEAIDYIKKALVAEPENGAFLDSLGWAYFKQNDMENAEKYLLEAARFVKGDPTIHDHIGDLYFKIGQLDKARDYWAESVRVGKWSKEQDNIQKVRQKLNQVEEMLLKGTSN